jgi:hypothetical protein
MTDPRPENLILRCLIKDRNGIWAWADVNPLNWKLVVGHYNNEVGGKSKMLLAIFAFCMAKFISLGNIMI